MKRHDQRIRKKPSTDQKASEILHNTIHTNLSSASQQREGSRDDIIIEDGEDDSLEQKKNKTFVAETPLD